MLALNSLPNGLKISGTLIAEMRLAQSVGIVRQLGGHSVWPINSPEVIDAVLVDCALQPNVGRALIEVGRNDMARRDWVSQRLRSNRRPRAARGTLE